MKDRLRVYNCGATDLGFALSVLVGPRKQAVEWSKKHYNATPLGLQGDEDAAGASWLIEGQGSPAGVVWFESFELTPDSVTRVAHELFHFVMDNLSAIGIPYCEQTEEAYAYELQARLGQTLCALWPKKKKR